MPTVVLVGTLDTKGDDYGYLRDRLLGHGVEVVVVDVGTREPRLSPDIDAATVAGLDRPG